MVSTPRRDVRLGSHERADRPTLLRVVRDFWPAGFGRVVVTSFRIGHTNYGKLDGWSPMTTREPIAFFRCRKTPSPTSIRRVLNRLHRPNQRRSHGRLLLWTLATAGQCLIHAMPCYADQTVLVTTNAPADGASGPFYTFALPALLNTGELRFAGTETASSDYVSSLYRIAPGSTTLIPLASQGQAAPGANAQFGVITYSSTYVMSANTGETAFYTTLIGTGVCGVAATSFLARAASS